MWWRALEQVEGWSKGQYEAAGRAACICGAVVEQ